MKEEIFRKKSIERIKSPESLNDYVRVVTPSVWIVLVAVILLLIGACIWGVFGRIESTVAVTVTVEEGTATGIVADTALPVGAAVRIDSVTYSVASVTTDDSTGRLFATFTFAAPLPDGTYGAEVTTGSVRPFSFLIN